MAMLKKTGVLLVLCAAVLTGGCNWLPFGFATIKELRESPAKFDGQEVKIKGKVTSVTKVDLLDIKLFMLDDGTGQVMVIPAGDMPNENDTVALSGKVENVAIIGGQSMGMHIREVKRLPAFGFGK